MTSRNMFILLLSTTVFAACGQASNQDKVVGGRCEGCEAALDYQEKNISWIDTLPDFNDGGRKLEITGTIYLKDGSTPAKDVLLYIYHTDQQGIYPTRAQDTGWARQHGYIRGWIKTKPDGKYRFYTLRPGAYPGRENPEHIHAIVKQPGFSPYYIDDYLFDDDPILTTEQRQRQRKRGGNGILKVGKSGNGILVIKRDIVLGENIPGYDE